MTSYGDLTAPCAGDAKEVEDCHTFDCTPYGKQYICSAYFSFLVCLKNVYCFTMKCF